MYTSWHWHTSYTLLVLHSTWHTEMGTGFSSSQSPNGSGKFWTFIEEQHSESSNVLWWESEEYTIFVNHPGQFTWTLSTATSVWDPGDTEKPCSFICGMSPWSWSRIWNRWRYKSYKIGFWVTMIFSLALKLGQLVTVDSQDYLVHLNLECFHSLPILTKKPPLWCIFPCPCLQWIYSLWLQHLHEGLSCTDSAPHSESGSTHWMILDEQWRQSTCYLCASSSPVGQFSTTNGACPVHKSTWLIDDSGWKLFVECVAGTQVSQHSGEIIFNVTRCILPPTPDMISQNLIVACIGYEIHYWPFYFDVLWRIQNIVFTF